MKIDVLNALVPREHSVPTYLVDVRSLSKAEAVAQLRELAQLQMVSPTFRVLVVSHVSSFDAVRGLGWPTETLMPMGWLSTVLEPEEAKQYEATRMDAIIDSYEFSKWVTGAPDGGALSVAATVARDLNLSDGSLLAYLGNERLPDLNAARQRLSEPLFPNPPAAGRVAIFGSGEGTAYILLETTRGSVKRQVKGIATPPQTMVVFFEYPLGVSKREAQATHAKLAALHLGKPRMRLASESVERLIGNFGASFDVQGSLPDAPLNGPEIESALLRISRKLAEKLISEAVVQ